MTNIIIQPKLSNEQLIDKINTFNTTPNYLESVLRRNDIELLNEIKHRTQFLVDYYMSKYNKKPPMAATIYCIQNNITAIPHCQNDKCNNEVDWNKHEFRKYCCLKCACSDTKWKQQHLETCMNLYGTNNPMQNQEIKNKCISSITKKYGGIGYASSSIKTKAEQTMISSYGVKNAGQSDIIRKRMESTCKQKYGVRSFSQTPQFGTIVHQKIASEKYPNILFASQWELLVYDFLYTNNISFSYQPNIVFTYKYDNKIWSYHPDFLVGDKVYEVKGDIFFKIDNLSGKEIMFLPWKGKLSLSEYTWECGKYEAKHQCMIQNNVVILRSKEVNDLTIELFQ